MGELNGEGKLHEAEGKVREGELDEEREVHDGELDHGELDEETEVHEEGTSGLHEGELHGVEEVQDREGELKRKSELLHGRR